MTREQARDEILQMNCPNILCELPTSFGKTKVALDLMKRRLPYINLYKVDPIHILIVVPRLVLIKNWKDEFTKWGMDDYLPYVEFVTYMSFPKKAGVWDMVIFDEVHHLSARCREAMGGFVMSNCIMLSATVGWKMGAELSVLFSELQTYKVTTKQAIDDEILPDPKVYLIPLYLDSTKVDREIIKNKSQKIELRIPYYKKWDYAKVVNRKLIISCTQREYYDYMTSLVNFYKKKSKSPVFRNKFLKASGDRLKWLSDQKTTLVKQLLGFLDKQRTLTFCNGIPQTEELGKYCINSKNKASMDNLAKFNEGKVDHITACNMLDEGINLTNCRVGVYATLNSSERLVKQKLGRLLRHPDPVIIIPYYVGTRDEEIVLKNMLEDYNPELVKTITNLTELKL